MKKLFFILVTVLISSFAIGQTTIDRAMSVWARDIINANFTNSYANIALRVPLASPTFGNTITLVDTIADDGVVYKHQLDDLGSIDGSGFEVSTMLIYRLTRLGTDAADTFTGVAYGHEFDLHYLKSTPGSRLPLVK